VLAAASISGIARVAPRGGRASIALGISYGIDGQLDKAMGVLKAAIEQDPEYPLFYYNLACALAESPGDNLDAGIANLGWASQSRANLNPGETAPDPAKDDSFARYADNPRFKEALAKFRSGPATRPAGGRPRGVSR
jgi:tetratricopeptide (TPR) repeat protein